MIRIYSDILEQHCHNIAQGHETLPFQMCLRWRHNDEKPAAGAATFWVFSENFAANTPPSKTTQWKNLEYPPPPKTKNRFWRGGIDSETSWFGCFWKTTFFYSSKIGGSPMRVGGWGIRSTVTSHRMSK